MNYFTLIYGLFTPMHRRDHLYNADVDVFKKITFKIRAPTTLKSEGEVTNKQKTNTRTCVNQRDDMLTKTRN
jgi:hypothetical protein